jgi:hypothetical protein
VPLGLPHSQFLSWDTTDQDKALAYRREMAKCCNRCGTRQSEWDEDEHAYLGNIRRCEGCGRLEDEEENLKDDRRGAHVELLPRQVAEARAEVSE